jgi:MoaA/NifB/PqqE/SkfB family radical SAM enzyme
MNEIVRRLAPASERRHWVRLTRCCNNRCLFCHDAPAQDGTRVPDADVRASILEGRRRGAKRLILSGGEATLHPGFLEYLAFGRESGYTWIQAITNGRMFGYPRFAAEARTAGLDEVTVSLHGHTPALHDRLAGVPGAFAQAVRGLVNCRAAGLVVSVDVVLNRLNLPFLREILQFHLALGVTEFDLLHLVPFGRGFDEFRDLLFPDPETTVAEVGRALALVDDHPEVYVWTNRLPMELLEGREAFCQDPHKLYDEVLGERQVFRELFASGIEPDCRGDRCPFCPVRSFCEAALHYARSPAETDGQGPDTVELTPEVIASFAAMDDEAFLAATGRGVRLPLRESLADALAATPELAAIRRLAVRLHRPVLNLPPCLGGPAEPASWAPLDPAVRLPNGRIDLGRFVAFFVREAWRVKSLRCRRCALDDRCPGLHVHPARLWGLGVLAPAEAG